MPSKKMVETDEEKNTSEQQPPETATDKIDDQAEKIGKAVDEGVEKINRQVEKIARHRDNSGGIVWAFFLIFLGVMFLLNTTGVVPWNVWDMLWRFWPIFLILGGIQIIFGRSRFTGFLVGSVALFAFCFIGLMAVASVNTQLLSDWNINLPAWMTKMQWGGGTENNETYRLNGSEYSDVNQREILIDIGAAKFTLKESSSSSYLEIDSVYYGDCGKPQVEETQDENTGDLRLKFEPIQENCSFGWSGKSPSYSLTVGQLDLKTDVDINLGAGKGEVDFSRLKLGLLQAKVGAGQLTVTLGEEVSPDQEVNLEVGAGDVTLVLPKDVGYKLAYQLGVGSIKIDGKEISKPSADNKTYESDNYQKADKNLYITVDVGVGAFKLNQQ